MYPEQSVSFFMSFNAKDCAAITEGHEICTEINCHHNS